MRAIYRLFSTHGSYPATVGIILLSLTYGLSNCTREYIATASTPPNTKPSSTSSNQCPCTSPTSTTGTSTTATSTTATSTTQTAQTDTLSVSPPRFVPNGGSFYMSTPVQLVADSLPDKAVVEYSLDNGKNWQIGSSLTLKTGGTLLSRIRQDTKVSRSRSASFSLYFKRMLIIGNSIMSHGPAPDIGWYNFNGMAASAPEKDFVHLLTGYLQQVYPALIVQLQSGGNFENQYGTSTYSLDEFNSTLQNFKPDIIIVRLGENVDDNLVSTRHFDTQFRQFLDRLASFNSSVRIVCTTSVWYKPNVDAVIRAVTTEKGYALVDLSFMIGLANCFASQYSNPGVAAHPNDQGMQVIADMIWGKVQ